MLHRVSFRSKSKRVGLERFSACFGCSPKVAAVLWNRMDDKSLLPEDMLVKHLLWGLSFLKLYNNQRVHAPGICGADEKTFQKWVWIVLDALGELELVSHRRPTDQLDAMRLSIDTSSALLSLAAAAAVSSLDRSSGRTVLWRTMAQSAR